MPVFLTGFFFGISSDALTMDLVQEEIVQVRILERCGVLGLESVYPDFERI